MKTGWRFLPGGILLALAAHGIHAETLSSLGGKCFSYTEKAADSSDPGTFMARDFEAQFPGSHLKLKIHSLTLKGNPAHFTAETLKALNAAAAYLTLSAYYHGIYPACPGLPGQELKKLARGGIQVNWDHANLEGNPHKFSIARTSIGEKPEGTEISANFDVSGIRGDRSILTPTSLHGALSFTPSPAPPYHVRFSRLNGMVDHSQIEGAGDLLAGNDITASRGWMKLGVTRIGLLIDHAASIAPAKVTAALLFARLMAHREPGRKVSWNVTLQNGKLKVNSVKIPLLLTPSSH